MEKKCHCCYPFGWLAASILTLINTEEQDEDEDEEAALIKEMMWLQQQKYEPSYGRRRTKQTYIRNQAFKCDEGIFYQDFIYLSILETFPSHFISLDITELSSAGV